MPYRLGVDLGTTFTAAAVAEDTGEPTLVGLGNRALQVPSVLFLKPDGEFLVGEAAERRGGAEPDRLVREFKRRIGDSVPIVVAGSPFSPQALTGHLLRWVVAVVAERMGGPAEEVVLTHPANWGPFRLELFAQVAAMAGVTAVRFCTEPEAAAAQYAAQTRVAPGDRVAVYDLGGGTFDACVLEKSATGFRALGPPQGVEHLGGVDFDEAVLRHVLGALGAPAAALDPEDPAVTVGLARLRRDCVEAKESLSTDVETEVPVALPGLTTSVRLTRAELEQMIRPALAETLSAMRRALASADVEAATLRSVLLVGGSSRIPVVSELVGQELGVPVALDTHPKHDVALGSVRTGSADDGSDATEAVPAVGAVVPSPSTAKPLPPATGASRGRRVRLLAVAVLAVVVVGLGAAAVSALTGDREPADDPASPTSSSPAASPASSPTSTPTPTPTSPAPPPRWRPGTDLPQPLEAAGAAVFGGAVWVVGGSAPSEGRPLLDTVWRFEDGWQPGPRLPVRLDSTAVATDGERLFVVGGRTGADSASARLSRDVFVLDGPDDDSWQVLNQLPAARASGAVAWDGQRLVFAGGIGPEDGRSVNQDDVWAWDGGDEWQVVGRLQRERQDLAAASDGEGRVWFVGGDDDDEEGDGRVPQGAVDLVQGDRVSRQPDTQRVRSVAAVWLPDRGVCVLGGMTRTSASGKDQLTDRVVCLPGTTASPTTGRLPRLRLPRAGSSAVVQDGAIWLIGGFGPARKNGGVQPGLPVVEILSP